LSGGGALDAETAIAGDRSTYAGLAGTLAGGELE
jgi:hypothetical protein